MKDLIKQVIVNFDEQQAIYRWVLNLAGQQLSLLQDNREGLLSGINELIAKRQLLMQQISQLNLENKAHQSMICQELQLEEFCLSNLAENIDKKDFDLLQQVIGSMGEVLAEINQLDKASHIIMSHNVVGVQPRVKKVDSQQVAQAYAEAIKTKMEN